MSRKVIQLQSHEGELFALCDDGTMWHKEDEFTKWQEMAPVPQVPSTHPVPLEQDK